MFCSMLSLLTIICYGCFSFLDMPSPICCNPHEPIRYVTLAHISGLVGRDEDAGGASHGEVDRRPGRQEGELYVVFYFFCEGLFFLRRPMYFTVLFFWRSVVGSMPPSRFLMN